MRSAFLIRTWAMLLLLGACTPAGQGPVPQAPGARVRVQNQAWLDVTMYVVSEGGARSRLGTVSATTTATLPLSAAVVGPGREVRFLADPVGSDAVASSFSMYVRPGDTVTLTLPPGLGR